MKAKSFDEFINESKQEEALNEDLATSLILVSQMALLGTVLGRSGIFDPVADWVDDKVEGIKSKIRRHRKMKMTNATYQEFADKIPQMYKALEKQWEAEIKKLEGELQSAIAAKEEYIEKGGDKRVKAWKGYGGIKFQPSRIQNEIDKLKKKDFFKYIYTSEDFMEKNKSVFPELDDTTSEQIRLIARMIRDYIKDGKVKDTYWKERKNQ